MKKEYTLEVIDSLLVVRALKGNSVLEASIND
jgi:hypothetical protein